MNGTGLDETPSVVSKRLANAASLVALIEAEASVSDNGEDNGPSGSGNVLGLKYR